MERTDNQPRWDAKRLVREYVKMSGLIEHYRGRPFDDMSWSNQIRTKRIASVLRAFMGLKEEDGNPVEFITSVFNDFHFERLLMYSPLQETDHAKMMALVKEAMNDDHQYDSLVHMANSYDEEPSYMERKRSRDRYYMLRVLLEYRLDAEKLISHFSGMYEGTVGVYMCVYAIRNSCIEPLERANEKIDDIIAMLLGDKFKPSFSEEELKADYDYPKETDHELNEWDCDNM